MENMRLTLSTFGLLVLAVAASAAAQSVGMQIVDTNGAPVGTVVALNGDNLKVKTDKHEVLLPKSSFTADSGKLLFAMTQAQLNAQIENAIAESAKAIKSGAPVIGNGGAAIGKIGTVENDQATIELDTGKKIRVPMSGLRGNADGKVIIGYTAEQLDTITKGDSTAPSNGL